MIQQTIAEARKVRIQAANYGFIVSCCNKTRSLDSKHPYKENTNNNNNNKNRNNNNNTNNSCTPSGQSKSHPPCTICGMSNHATPECRTKQSEFANHSDRRFIGSESHRRSRTRTRTRTRTEKLSEKVSGMLLLTAKNLHGKKSKCDTFR